MASIYSIPNWSNTITYVKNEIVRFNNGYYYSDRDVPIGAPLLEPYFKGYYEDKYFKPLFLWSPSFGSNASTNLKINSTQFDEGFEQAREDGMNSDALELDLVFEKRDLLETRAILHFLNQRSNGESFYYKHTHPYDKIKIYTCLEWDYSTNFTNSHNIKAKFIEKFN